MSSTAWSPASNLLSNTATVVTPPSSNADRVRALKSKLLSFLRVEGSDCLASFFGAAGFAAGALALLAAGLVALGASFLGAAAFLGVSAGASTTVSSLAGAAGKPVAWMDSTIR